MKITSCAKSDVGRRRPKNEDRFLSNEAVDLYAVADGMGGYAGGEVASEMAVAVLDASFAPIAALPAGALSIARAAEALRSAVRLASRRIHERKAAEPNLAQMGTTAVAMLFLDDHAILANVGDSRAYRIRDGGIEQLTADHSLVAEQVRAGIITPEQARTHRMKNWILRSVGTEGDVEVDTFIVPLEPGDHLLLCSDGLTGMLEDHEIRDAVLGATTVESAVDRLVALANDRGGEDNVTVVLARVDALDRRATGDTTTDTLETPPPA